MLVCNDGGILFDLLDDIYIVGVWVIFVGFDVLNIGWCFVFGNGNFENGGFYGEIVEIGLFLVFFIGVDIIFIIVDNGFISCMDDIVIILFIVCSLLECDMVVSELVKCCDNNGILFDIIDDVYFFILGVDGNLLIIGWMVIIIVGIFMGSYGSLVEIGLFLVGEDVIIMVFDQEYFENCSSIIIVEIMVVCLEELSCEIEVVVEQVYSDNGMLVDYIDDIYDVSFFVINGGFNGMYELMIFNGLSFIGIYGEVLIIEDYIVNEDISYMIIDLMDSECIFMDWIFGQVVVGDYIWIDVNVNGIQDVGELLMVGVEVFLSGFDVFIGQVVSVQIFINVDGCYLFINFNQGLYQVIFVLFGGYIFIFLNQGVEVNDSDVDFDMGGQIVQVVVFLVMVNLDFDVGFVLIEVCEILISVVIVDCINSQLFIVVVDVDVLNGGVGWIVIDNVIINNYSGIYGSIFV